MKEKVDERPYIPSAFKRWATRGSAKGMTPEQIAADIGAKVSRQTKRTTHLVPVAGKDGVAPAYFYTDYDPHTKKHVVTGGDNSVSREPKLKRIVESKPLTVVRPRNVHASNTFAVVTYWWGNGRNNRNLQRPCPDEMPKDATSPVPLSAPQTFNQMVGEWAAMCERIGVHYILQEYPEFAVPGMYQTAINAKPLFILKALETAKAAGLKGVVYIDGDMAFHKYPEIFDMSNVDYMARGWNIDPRASENYLKNYVCFDPFAFETSGGIMYFGDTRKARQLLKEWIVANDRAANAGKADDRIISVIVNSRQYLVEANVIQLPIEYLWLTDIYEEYVKHYNPRHVICEHPHCLTSEERAREQGASNNRDHILSRLVTNMTNCQRGDWDFYEYIFFEKGMVQACASYKAYLEILEELYVDKKTRSIKWTKYDLRYGDNNKVADAKLKAHGWHEEAVLAPLPAGELAILQNVSAGDVLGALMKGQRVLWIPHGYPVELVHEVSAAARQSGSRSRSHTRPSRSRTLSPGGKSKLKYKMRMTPLGNNVPCVQLYLGSNPTVALQVCLGKGGRHYLSIVPLDAAMPDVAVDDKAGMGPIHRALGVLNDAKMTDAKFVDLVTNNTEDTLKRYALSKYMIRIRDLAKAEWNNPGHWERFMAGGSMSVAKKRALLKGVMAAVDKAPDVEFCAAIKSQPDNRWVEESHEPIFHHASPMYFSPTSRVLRHLLFMSEMDTLNTNFNKSFIFLTNIRCKWVTLD
jgi:hypothetical protein